MDEQSNRRTPRRVVDALAASVRDMAEGRVHDARAVQAEARRMLANHEGARSDASLPSRETRSRRSRSTT